LSIIPVHSTAVATEKNPKKKPRLAPYEGGELAFVGGTVQDYLQLLCSALAGHYTDSCQFDFRNISSTEETLISRVKKQLFLNNNSIYHKVKNIGSFSYIFTSIVGQFIH
jgi:hypothetical protein